MTFYTVPWMPEVDGEIPSFVIEALQQIDHVVNHDPGGAVELHLLVGCMARDTGRSVDTCADLIAMAVRLGMVKLGVPG